MEFVAHRAPDCLWWNTVSNGSTHVKRGTDDDFAMRVVDGDRTVVFR